MDVLCQNKRSQNMILLDQKMRINVDLSGKMPVVKRADTFP